MIVAPWPLIVASDRWRIKGQTPSGITHMPLYLFHTLTKLLILYKLLILLILTITVPTNPLTLQSDQLNSSPKLKSASSPQTGLWRWDDQPKCPHFSKLSSLCCWNEYFGTQHGISGHTCVRRSFHGLGRWDSVKFCRIQTADVDLCYFWGNSPSQMQK